MSERRVWTEQDLRDLGFVAPEPEVYSITAANSKHSEKVDKRARDYALRMMLRIVCIVAACLVDGWLRWGFVALAGILPWAAVVIANGDDRANSDGEFMQYLTEEQRGALTATDAPQSGSSNFSDASEQHATPETQGPLIIDGEIIESETKD